MSESNIPSHVIDQVPTLVEKLADLAFTAMQSEDPQTRHMALTLGQACGTIQILAEALGE